MHLGSFGMSVNIGQRFLRDAKQRSLDIARQTADIGRNIQVDSNFCSLGKAFAEPAQCRQQAGLVEHWRVQQIGHGADLALALLDQRAALLERRPGHRFQLRAQTQGLPDAEGRAEQVLRGRIVQFARDAPMRLVLRLQELAGKPAQTGLGYLHLADVFAGDNEP